MKTRSSFMALALWILSTAAVADHPRSAAPDFTRPGANGKSVHLADYKGRVVLLNFWATWCHGCKTELPWIVDFETHYGKDGLTVIGVAMDEDGWKSVKPFAAEKHLNYELVLGDEKLAALYQVSPLPQTFLIDRAGYVAASYPGVIDRSTCEHKIRQLVQHGA